MTAVQSVISIDSMISWWVNAVHHGTLTVIRFAFMNGRSVGDSPSMTTSSSANSPGATSADSLPMCRGRSRYFEPATSARCFRVGPRSTLKSVTNAAATTATTIARSRSANRRHRGRRRAGSGGGGVWTGGLRASAMFGTPDLLVGRLFNDDEDPASFDRGPGGDGHVLDPAGLGGTQLILHLHRLDDDDALLGGHVVAGGHEH